VGRPGSAIIVGGGVIGLALGRELASRGVETTILERATPGSEASSAAAGLLSPQSEAPAPGPFLDLALASRDLYPSWAETLRKETGIDVGYRRTGILRCTTTAAAREAFAGRLAWQSSAGLPWREVGRDEIRRLSDGLVSPSFASGFFFPEDGVVDPVPLVHAIAASVSVHGARLLAGRRARRFLVEGGVCTGVEADGPGEGEREELRADCVVDAAGAWAAFDDETVDVPVEPVRGQIVELVPVSPLPTVAWSEDAYLVPRIDGRILVGSTEERVGFAREVTAGAVSALIEAACRLVPGLAAAVFSRAWAGLRPGSPDGLPILGASGVAGLWLATGHFKNGILLAPETARRLTDAILGDSAEALRPFSPARFPPRAGCAQNARSSEDFG
jgi:glycine oxidase